MGAFSYDSGSSWSKHDQRAAHNMCPHAKKCNLDRIWRQFNQTTGAFEGAVDTQEVDDYSNFGDFASAAAGSGLALDSDNSVGVGVYCDDGEAAVGSGVLMRAVRGRVLLTYTDGNREQEVAGVIGQCVSAAGTNRHNMCGVMGSYERSAGTVVVDGQAASTDAWIQAAIIGRVGVGNNNTTLNENGRLCGVAAMSNTTAMTNNGVYAAFYAGAWGSSLLDWAYGLYLEDDKVTTGVYIGACTTGVKFSGTVGIGIDLSSGTLTTDLKLSNSDTIHNTSSGLITLTATKVTCSGELTCETFTQSGGKGSTGLSIAAGGGVTTDGSISADGGFVSPSTPAYHFHGSGAATTMAIYLPSMTKPLLQGVATIAMGTHTNVVEVNAITTTNGAYVFCGGKFITYPSTADQASVTIYGLYSHVTNAFAIGALRGVYGYIECSSTKTISNESSALFGDVNVDEDVTVTSDVLSALHAKVRGDSDLTGTLVCLYADAEMSVDAVIKGNVDNGKTATAGLVLSGAGTYTTGIVLSTATFGTAMNIGSCTTAINFSGTIPTCMTVQAVGTTASHVIDMIDAYTGMVIETGSYADTAGSGITLNSTNKRPVSFVFDDANTAMTGDVRGVQSRIAVIANHTGALSLTALRGQVKLVGGVDYDADYLVGVYGYLEVAGASNIGLNASHHAACGVRARVEIGASMEVETGYLAGVYTELNTTGAWTVTQSGVLAAYVVETTDQKSDAWGHGLYIATSAADVGVTIGSCTTGIALSGTMTTAISLTPANFTQGIVMGEESFAASGSGLPLDGDTVHEGVAFYFDDGGTKLGAGYTEALRAGFLVSTEITTADVSIYTAHDYVYLAADVTTAGGVGGTWGSMLVKTGVTITTSSGVCDFSGAHFTCDVPSGAEIGTGTWACGASVGGNLGGTHTGSAAGYRVRVPSAGRWDVGLRIEPTSCVQGIQVGSDSDSSGSGIPLVGGAWATSQGNSLYCDDGGATQTGYTECFTARYLLTANITAEADVSVAAVHSDLAVNCSYDGKGGLSASWGNAKLFAGKTLTTDAGWGCLSGGHFGVDLEATSVLAANSWAAGLSVGCSIGDITHTGYVVGLLVRKCGGTHGLWDAAFGFIDGDQVVQNSAAGSTNDRHLRVLVMSQADRSGTLYTIPMYKA